MDRTRIGASSRTPAQNQEWQKNEVPEEQEVRSQQSEVSRTKSKTKNEEKALAEVRSLATASLRRESVRLKAKAKPARYAPGEFALRERTLPGRRFVEFPLVQGKIADKVQLFTTTNCHSLTIEFQDRTSLHLDIEPGFTVHTQFMQSVKGELEILAEWPPIHIPAQEP